jgi:tRNA(Ile2) C34 agmatinyltransferase TiaS
MRELKTLRTCPVCRVAMVHTGNGWSCPQCGSAIVDVPTSGESKRRENDRDNSPSLPTQDTRSLNATA